MVEEVVTKVEEVAEMAVEKIEDFVSNATISAKETITSLTTPTVSDDKTLEYNKVGDEYGPTIAAPAAGGSKKSLKKQRKRIKKVTKRKKKINNYKNVSKRKRGGKKPKKTKRRN
jgi:inosine/xanthosine triphosphate pyrophosphatase family protein